MNADGKRDETNKQSLTYLLLSSPSADKSPLPSDPPLWPGPETPETPADRRPIRPRRTPAQLIGEPARLRREARSLALYTRDPNRRRPSAARALELRARRAEPLERLEERS